MRHEAKIIPSILSADFLNLKNALEQITAAGASIIHLDIMDGNFVPNISFGPSLVSAIDAATDLILDTHLMIRQPEEYLERCKAAGSDILTVHVETCTHLHRTITRIKELGMKAGVCINPSTPVQMLDDIVQHADLVLIMSVNPGFGGQKFIPTTIDKIRRVKAMITERELSTIIEVDGGIDSTNVKEVLDAGALYLVAGNAVFGDGNIIHNYTSLNTLLT
jgi:ribulose-phosphate 3-epimerase